MHYDLIIRGGTIVDGTGREPYVGDVAIAGEKIAAIGTIDGEGTREIDASGLLVTPGFIDLHTHYDGQAIWSNYMAPSSSHGVTTVLMGNCGVGFAPCRAEDHDLLVDVMSGVEDIPNIVMVEGLPWNWETFPEFLNALEAGKRDIDVATLLPHSALRVYVMGERGARREPANADDLEQMRAITKEAVQAGALGFASSRLIMDRTGAGQMVPSYDVAHAELEAITDGMAAGGGGLLQFVPDLPMEGYDSVLAPLISVAHKFDQPLTFTLATGNSGPQAWPGAIRLIEAANAAGDKVTAQMFPRPIGLVMGLELTLNPFVLCPSYQEIAHLPLADRVARMRDPEIRARMLAEPPGEGVPITAMARHWDWIFPLDENPDYEPSLATSISAKAAAKGVTPEAEVYDRLLDHDGHAMLYVALGNFQDGSLDTVGTLIRRDDVVLGLGDGGAHYGMICDASFPTFMLTHWVRDRAEGKLSISEAVKAMTVEPAAVIGLSDRGRISPGYKADLNIIDLKALHLHKPIITRDLPGGGGRLDQKADGYVATIVSGIVIAETGKSTGALPGQLVRGRQGEPVLSN